MLIRRVLVFASLVVALAVSPARAQPAGSETLREVLRAHHVPFGPGGPGPLDRRITSYVVEDHPDLLTIAYYYVGPDSTLLPDTLHVGAFDPVTGAWAYAALERARTSAPTWDVGSVMAIHHSRKFLYLDTHLNPSGGTIIVLTRALRPFAALSGWSLAFLPGDRLIYHRSMVHFAPTHPAELWTYDPISKLDALLYPRKPYDKVRREYIDSTRALYTRLGESWFLTHNHHGDPERFDSGLVDSILTDDAGTKAAFHMRFGQDYGTDAATPVVDVVVLCGDIQSGRPRCTETKLSDLQRRHPGWTTDRILHEQLGAPAPGTSSGR